MERIGEKLQNAREAKKLTLKEVAKETNITQKYIEALEDEEFDRFPGETYTIGFLRRYAEYLKLDADDIIQAYRGYKIGESATPLEELTRPTRSPIMFNFSSLLGRYKNGFYISGVVLVLVLVVWLFSTIFSSQIEVASDDSIKKIKDEYEVSQKTKIENIRNLQLTNDRGFTLVYMNEVVQFLVENQEVLFILKEIKENKVIIEMLPDKSKKALEMEKPKLVRLKDCPREVMFTLKGVTENRAKIMIMLGKRLKPEKKEDVDPKIAENKNENQTGDNTRITAQNQKNLKIIFEAEFMKKTYIELYLDGMKKRKGIIAAGTQRRWEASEYIQLKIGNAGGLNARINGKVYKFGLPGQVANKIITWKKDVRNPNVYKIVIKDW